MMAAALGVAAAERGGLLTHYGPFPAVVVALLVGGIGVMLVVTDMMVRGLYAEIGKAAARGDQGDDTANASDDQRR
jgi:hypothetical protein